MFILVTGGAASGKSELAEQCVCALGDGKRLYLATMEPMDEESRRRIGRHHQLRAGKGFDTLEYYKNFAAIEPPEGYQTVLLECMSNLLANEMYSPGGAGGAYFESILTGVERLAKGMKHLVIVTNEVHTDGVFYDEFTMQYVKNLGKLNGRLAERADIFIEAVCGLPNVRKGWDIYESLF